MLGQEPAILSDPRLKEFTGKRFAAIGDADAMQTYHWLETHEEHTRLEARLAETARIDLWQRAINIHCEPFLPGKGFDFGSDPETLVGWQKNFSGKFRMYQLAMAAGTSKLALDASLSGYYTQALTLCRTMFEGWKRIAFTRRSPQDVFRWYPEDFIPKRVKELPGYSRAARKPNGNELAQAFSMSQTDQDRIDALFLGSANKHIAYLNEHAHPTLEGASQTMTDPNWAGVLHPNFSHLHLERCLHVGMSAEFLLLQEISLLSPPPKSWINDHAMWMRDFDAQFQHFVEKDLGQ